MPHMTQAELNQKLEAFHLYLEEKEDLTKFEINHLIELQKKQKIIFRDEFLAINEEKALETTRIGYTPYEQITYSNRKNHLAPQKPDSRHLTRYRMVYGPVEFDDPASPYPTTIPLITTCAINLSTSDNDLKNFSSGGKTDRTLIADIYQNECEKIADFIVGTAKKEGHTHLIMPAFGVGVYISKLSHQSKELAKEIMYKAFAKAASKHQINVEWVIWLNPANPNAANSTIETQKQLTTFAPNNPYIQSVIHEDLLAYTNEQVLGGQQCVMLNAGSDRTIGGRFIKIATTIEEQLVVQSNNFQLLKLHSTLNPFLESPFLEAFKNRKKQFVQPAITSHQQRFFPEKNSSQKEIFIEIAAQIKEMFLTKEKPMLFNLNKGNISVSFKNESDAGIFANGLYKNGIQSFSTGNAKKVQTNGSYFYVVLTKNDYNTLSTMNISQSSNSARDAGFFNSTNAPINNNVDSAKCTIS